MSINNPFYLMDYQASLVTDGKESACNAGDPGMATYSSILAWRIPWTEEPGRLQSMGSQRVGHNWVTDTQYDHFNEGCQILQIKIQPYYISEKNKNFFSINISHVIYGTY